MMTKLKATRMNQNHQK